MRKRLLSILVGLSLPLAASAFVSQVYTTNNAATVDAHVLTVVGGGVSVTATNAIGNNAGYGTNVTLLGTVTSTNLAATILTATNNLLATVNSGILSATNNISANILTATNNLLVTANANILTATNNNLASANANILSATNNLLVNVNAVILTATNNNLASAAGLINNASNNIVGTTIVAATNSSFAALTNYLEPIVFVTNFSIPTYRTNYTVSLTGLGVTTNLLIREDLYLVPQSSNPLGLLMTSRTLLRSSRIGGADYSGCPPFAQTTSDGGATWSVTYDGENHISFADTNGSPTTISAIQAAANFNLQSRYSWVKHQ